MQPIAVISSPASGLLYINGRLAGESGPENTITVPFTPNGTVYLQHFPFGRRYRPGSYRLSLKSGEMSVSTADDTCRLLTWPGNITEIALMPLTAVPAESEYSIIDGLPAAILRGDSSLLRIGQQSIALPDGAKLPDSHRTLNGSQIYTGRAGEATYLAVFSSENLMPLGAIIADSITINGNQIMAESDLNDTARHHRTDTYEPTADSLNLISSEITSHRHPESAEDTAIAAIEAALLGLTDEAAQYLAEDAGIPTAGIDGVISMKYPAPGKHSAIGLIERISPFAARVIPLYYKALQGNDGKWKIHDFQK